ncbi:MAG: family 43 glycosylhydrolase [Ruminococcus sp.]|nr:family 43 glycosylhydrolase [Ruminococcus sp.]
MPNPILPLWEYIPDGEPRVFGDRVYLYGSHDNAGADNFCDKKLKVWSAPINDLNNWVCHGDSFRLVGDEERPADIKGLEDCYLYAPDVIEKDGVYYLYMYVFMAGGIVAKSDKPEGPFKLISTYQYDPEDVGDGGIFNDPGVLVDDDGRVYIYYGFEKSHSNEINPENMVEIIKGSYRPNMVGERDRSDDAWFFEASSIRKIGDTYYFIYSPRLGNRLAYATSKTPQGPFEYRGYIVDNGDEYPAGNDHGSICNINGQWYIFYHRMTNGTITSRRACVEKIEILPDGSIPTVEMTSLGFEDALDPYKITEAEIACVLKGGAMVTEKDRFTRVITNITNGCIAGYKYFEFGEDNTGVSMQLYVKTHGTGCRSRIHVYIDSVDDKNEIGVVEIGSNSGEYSGKVKCVTGRHALYFKAEYAYEGAFTDAFDKRNLFDLCSFVFIK